MSRSFTQDRSRSGFTLIELLVVIAIIAILAAILFPVFAKAREKARQITCVSNMKQIGLALIQYEQDYDETHPPVLLKISGNNVGWQLYVYSYLKSTQVFQCPSNSSTTVVSTSGQNGYPTIIDDYAANVGCMNGQWYQVYYFQGCGPFAGVGTNGNDAVTTPNILSQFLSPASTIDVLETRGNANNGPAGGNPPYSIDFVADDPVYQNDLYAGHTELGNFLFVDGHVKSMRPDQTLTSTVNMWTIDNSQNAPNVTWGFNVSQLQKTLASADAQFK